MGEEAVNPEAMCAICEDNPEAFSYVERIIWLSRILHAGFKMDTEDLSLEAWEDIGVVREYQEAKRLQQMMGAMFGSGKNHPHE